MERKSFEWLNNLLNLEEKEPKGWKKVAGSAVTLVLAMALVAVTIAFIVILVQIGQGKAPSLFHRRFYYIVTDSMTPNINVGDVILSKTVTEKDTNLFTVGAVITYTAESGSMKGKEITHRIVEGVHFDEKINDYVVLTRGDKAGAKTDDPVRLSAINAVMVKKSAFLGWLLSIFRNGAGFAFVIALPLCIMLVCLVVKLVVTIKTPAKESHNEESEHDVDREAKIEELKKQAIEEYLKNRFDSK